MKYPLVYLASFLFLSTSLFAQERNKSEFIPGDREIFVDSMKRELFGEFPSKWDIDQGNAEVMRFEDGNVIGFTASGSNVFPLMKEKDYLPERFTIEMEVYFHNYGNEGYTVYFNGRKISFRINRDGIKSTAGYIRRPQKNPIGWRTVQVSFNKRALKVYYQGERLLNLPRVVERPTRMSINALSHGGSKEKYAMIRNIRIAEGGVPLYNRLVTDGRLEMNNIHFDHNQATIKPHSLSVLQNIADMLLQHPDINLSIEGHTDSDGDTQSNQTLSEKRAEAVKQALIERKIQADRLSTKGWGESKPLAENDSTEGRSMNRRVTFILQ